MASGHAPLSSLNRSYLFLLLLLFIDSHVFAHTVCVWVSNHFKSNSMLSTTLADPHLNPLSPGGSYHWTAILHDGWAWLQRCRRQNCFICFIIRPPIFLISFYFYQRARSSDIFTIQRCVILTSKLCLTAVRLITWLLGYLVILLFARLQQYISIFIA